MTKIPTQFVWRSHLEFNKDDFTLFYYYFLFVELAAEDEEEVPRMLCFLFILFFSWTKVSLGLWELYFLVVPSASPKPRRRHLGMGTDLPVVVRVILLLLLSWLIGDRFARSIVLVVAVASVQNVRYRRTSWFGHHCNQWSTDCCSSMDNGFTSALSVGGLLDLRWLFSLPSRKSFRVLWPFGVS